MDTWTSNICCCCCCCCCFSRRRRCYCSSVQLLFSCLSESLSALCYCALPLTSMNYIVFFILSISEQRRVDYWLFLFVLWRAFTPLDVARVFVFILPPHFSSLNHNSSMMNAMRVCRWMCFVVSIAHWQALCMWLSLFLNEGCVLCITINICTLIDAEQWYVVLAPQLSMFDPSPTNGVAGSSSRWPVPTDRTETCLQLLPCTWFLCY